MEDPPNSTDSVSISDRIRLSRRQFTPDVPEDVEMRSCHISMTQIETFEPTLRLYPIYQMPYSRSDGQRLSVMWTPGRKRGQSPRYRLGIYTTQGTISHQKEDKSSGFPFPRHLCHVLLTHCVSSEILRILRSARPSGTLTTRLWP